MLDATRQIFEATKSLDERSPDRRTMVLAASALDLDLLPELYRFLQHLEPVERLDLVLYGRGGEINAARRIALVLRRFAKTLRFIVPHHCQSSCTALALSGDQIIGGDLAMFSPIDPRLNASDGVGEESPSALASEDVRLFREMGEKWFGISADERAQLLEYLAASIFPTTLTSLYRASEEVKAIGEELIKFQLPEVSSKGRTQIIEQLLFGYHSHSYSLTIDDLEKLGLNVARDPQVESEAWKIAQQLPHIVGGGARQSPQDPRTDVLIGTGDEVRVRQWLPGTMAPSWSNVLVE